MTPERFRRTAARFERLADAHPGRYRLALAALGVLTFAVLGFLAAVLRATTRAPDRPRGVPVTREEVPALFAALDEVRAAAPGPRLHAVLVSDELDAGVWQTPRLGFPGATLNELALGWPLLAALGPEALRAVLAHELAHVAGGHGESAAWVHRLRQTFDVLGPELEARRGPVARALRRLLASYRPWFSAASLALARAGEREADREAARIAGASATADALLGTRLAEHALARHLQPRLRAALAASAAPPERHLEEVPEALALGMTGPVAELALLVALDERARPGETHASLADRLLALGEAPRVPDAPPRSAAEVLLGEAGPRIRLELERRWRERVAGEWAVAHAQAQARRRLRPSL
ncbi:MAG: M48 family metallopeptidase [Anaeromyxobacteraceae bacterium]